MRRSKKSIYNMFWGVLTQIITLVFGLIVPRFFILNYGSEVNGLQGSISYIYTYISLLESGIGLATVQALLGAIGRSDRSEVDSVLAATNIQYKKIAKIYALFMLLVAIIYPLTITTSVDKITVFFMVILSGVGSLISFLFYGKFVLLLQADGRSYVVSIVNLLSYLLTNIIKIFLISSGQHFIVVYCASAVISLLVLLIYKIYEKKAYPWLDYKVTPKMAAISQSKNVLVHQISGIVCNSTDVLVLTYLVRDLRLVSIYNVYIMIFDAVKSLIMNIFGSVNFIMGQTYNTNILLYRKYHRIYETMDISVSFAFYSIAYVMITPFLSIYTAGITDISYIDKYLPLLFVSIKLLTSGREPASQLISYAGHFKQTQYRSVIETVINVVVSLVASYYLGIYGVLLGTVVALAYRTIDMYIYTSKKLLDRSVWVSIRLWIIYIFAFSLIVIINSHLNICVNNYIDFFLKAAICGCLILIYYFIVTCIFNFDVIRRVIQKFTVKRKNL